MKNELLEEIRDLCRKAIRKTDEKIINESVTGLDKKAFVSIGGIFDSVIILTEELERQNENDS